MSSDDEARVREWLGHIVDNADSALSYVAGLSYEKWLADRMRVGAVERRIERIGKASLKIGAERIADVAPDLPNR